MPYKTLQICQIGSPSILPLLGRLKIPYEGRESHQYGMVHGGMPPLPSALPLTPRH